MSTLLVSIQNQITALDARLSTISPTSVAADGTSVTNPDWIALSDQRMKLEAYLGRLDGSAPMIVRGRLRGLR